MGASCCGPAQSFDTEPTDDPTELPGQDFDFQNLQNNYDRGYGNGLGQPGYRDAYGSDRYGQGGPSSGYDGRRDGYGNDRYGQGGQPSGYNDQRDGYGNDRYGQGGPSSGYNARRDGYGNDDRDYGQRGPGYGDPPGNYGGPGYNDPYGKGSLDTGGYQRQVSGNEDPAATYEGNEFQAAAYRIGQRLQVLRSDETWSDCIVKEIDLTAMGPFYVVDVGGVMKDGVPEGNLYAPK
jgi:hypothetical protein